MTELYTIEILRLAAGTAKHPRLNQSDGTAERRSKVCGSRIVVDVTVDEEGRVLDYGHEVKACALGQASASILANHMKGRSVNELIAARDALANYLAGSSNALPDWPGIEALERARPYPARHTAIRLPFEAAADAIQQANSSMAVR